ncbi:hypothetical protein M8C21_019780 [Ambrosia artemisiifolia]|uniref:Morc S5 domain-containing protein n=1 Tax=Ambrosia artemisiifolia TaxID=4212 RepID=A0AAD5GI97_AMBAR|nr:hypothetical protein M8C21_019780 [Ambrosia artemisiifolia]
MEDLGDGGSPTRAAVAPRSYDDGGGVDFDGGGVVVPMTATDRFVGVSVKTAQISVNYLTPRISSTARFCSFSCRTGQDDIIVPMAYASMLCLRKFKNFKIILRGKPVDQYNIADDLRNPQVNIYRPHIASIKEVTRHGSSNGLSSSDAGERVNKS